MKRRSNRLYFTALFAILLALILGCTQSEDIIAPAAATDITLTPARLVSPPDGYVYALWLIDKDDEAVFIDVFDWNSDLYRFMDTSGNRIDSVWTVGLDILDPKFRYLALTIEALSGPDRLDTTDHGPIMLLDAIADPKQSPMKMIFPMDLWLGSLTFCVETPTDGNSQSNDAGGVWFALYVYDSVLVTDTTRLITPFTIQSTDRPLDIDTISYWDCLEYSGPDCIDSQEVTASDPYDWVVADTSNLEELANTLDTIGFRNDTLRLGTLLVSPVIQLPDTVWLDTMFYQYMTWDYVATPVNVTDQDRTDSIGVDQWGRPTWFTVKPFQDYNYQLIFDYRNTNTHSYMIDRFLSAHDELPDLDTTDWHYRGWVLSSELAPPSVPEGTFGKLTLPKWMPVHYDIFLRPIDGGIISTGSFNSFDSADDENPYSGVSRVPPFPGEDFINGVPGGVSGFCAGEGTIIVTLEPNNYNSDSTNFPLLLFTGPTPAINSVNISIPHVQMFPMINQYSAVENNPFGFPSIAVKINRH